MKEYIGIDVGGTSVKMGIVDAEGTVRARRELSYRDSGSASPVMQVIISGVREMISEEGMSLGGFTGIGVSAAGCINSVSGCVAGNGGNIPGWSRTEVCRELNSEFGLPVTLANDANCAVLGEYWTGAAKGYTDVLGVTLGTGVGGGVITGGKLLEGSRGYAGEIGHFPTHAGGEHCVCGLDGCFERYASTSALTRAAAGERPEWKSGRELFEAAGNNEPEARRLIGAWLDEIAYGIAGLVHVFDPQLVLIGGGVSDQQELLIEPLRKKVLSMVMPDLAEGLEFRSAMLGNDAGMVGAVCYFMSRENA